MHIQKQYVETEVLIIGTGGAGLRAAIEAYGYGVRVLVVSKGNFLSGCTAVSMGGMLAAFDSDDDADRHFNDTIEGGDHINDERMVRLLVDHACRRTEDLERYGTRFEKDNGQYKLFPYTGSSVARGVLADEPYHGGYVRGLTDEVKKLCIEVQAHIVVVDLVREAGRVVGAIALNTDANTLLIINAQATILATGGAGNLYNLTTNPSDITGDGYALAYRVGARLTDMEFVQGRVCMIYPYGMRGTPPPGDGLVTLGGRFYNAVCERYMGKYFPDKLELVTRAQMSICAQKEIQAGRHTPNDGVYGDLSGVPKEDLLKFERFMKACEEEQFDPMWQPYEWAPGAHHFMGGVVIDERCRTDIDGLFAAGEIAAGVHGANRLAGNALTETQVFGAIAGESAALEARGSQRIPISSNQIEAVEARIEAIVKRNGGLDPQEVKAELSNVISVNAGVIRNEDGLRNAVQSIGTLKKEKIPRLHLAGEKSFLALSHLIEIENLLTVGEFVMEAALMRTETRGAHNREDYPQTDDQWVKHIVFQRKESEATVAVKSIDEM